jgi:N-acetylglucosaminyldiphosphoundecaprenol N-acetyl-beta-D-mannosaminyltransferase
VGLGTPQQDHFLARFRDQLGAVLVAVGAAFDFLAGEKRQAPDWMQDRGLEWTFRLIMEPRRLWRRYLIGNAVFLAELARGIETPVANEARR